MTVSEYPNAIAFETLISKAQAYDSAIPSSLQALETICRRDVPAILKRRKDHGGPCLEKSEITELMSWKLKRGKYRPNLPKLLAENSDSDIQSVSSNAFAIYASDPTDVNKPLNTLAKLRGIGPATASLLLSCYDEHNIPFFSDELYRWIFYEEGKGKGWDRKIGYTMKEYTSLLERVKGLQERLKETGDEVSALTIEKAAYVISREDMLKQVTGDGPKDKDTEGERQRKDKKRSIGENSKSEEVDTDPSSRWVKIRRRKA